MALNNDLVKTRGAKQEGALDANTIGGHAADGDVRVVAALAQADHDSLELLNTFAFAFLDLDVYANGITCGECGDFFILFGFESLDNICHCLSSLRCEYVVF